MSEPDIQMTPERFPSPVLPPSTPKRYKLFRYLFALLTLEIGLFLVIFPWTDNWMFNYIQDTSTWLRDVWQDPYFRGAISGLGFVNVYLAFLDILNTTKRS
jgi:hypothetical protein